MTSFDIKSDIKHLVCYPVKYNQILVKEYQRAYFDIDFEGRLNFVHNQNLK